MIIVTNLEVGRSLVTFPATQLLRPLVTIKLYCKVTEAHAAEQLAQSCYIKVECLCLSHEYNNQTIASPVHQCHYATHTHTKQRTYLSVHTRNSAIADKPRDAFRGQSRTQNMLPFHMLGMISY